MFDIKKASTIITNSNNPILDTIGSQFGVPQCLMDFSKDLLGALPFGTLGSFRDKIAAGKNSAISIFNNTMAKGNLLTNIFQYDDGFGKFTFLSLPSKAGIEEDSLGLLNDLDFLGNAIGLGAEAWLMGEAALDQVGIMKSCIQKFQTLLALKNGTSALAHNFVGLTVTDPVTGEEIEEFFVPPPAGVVDDFTYKELQESLEIASSFILAADSKIQEIQEVMVARQEDPVNNPEPVFNGDLVLDDGTMLSDLTTSYNVATNVVLDDQGRWIQPTEGKIIISTEDARIGPPVAKSGQYLFSKTGLYYDSYGGGLEYEGCITNIVNAVYFDDDGNPIPGTGVPDKAIKFLLDFNPNLGGKGTSVSWRTFNQWANTVFDITNINESPEIQEWYKKDTMLQVLTDQRNRESYDLSSIVDNLISQGSAEDSAIVVNQKQIILSKIASNNSKIDRRKKQIEVHFVLNPNVEIGKVPINNLEELDAGLIAIQKELQEEIIFRPNEVSGIVLPLCPSFVKSEVPQDAFTVQDIMVPRVGAGGIINVDKNLSLGTSGTVLSLNDHIENVGIVSVYNFLDADLVSPDSHKYEVINHAAMDAFDKPAQLVASSVGSLFPSGVGIPFFRGVCNFFSGIDGDGNPKASLHSEDTQYLYSPYRPYGYSRVQSGWNDIDSLFYSKKGATIEAWVHIPDLLDETGLGWNASNDLSATHRVLFGCENRGGSASGSNDEWIIGPRYGSDTVRGLLIGFSRDRRLTLGQAPSNSPADNSINNGLVFYMAPTQSIDTSGVTFYAASADAAFCAQDEVGGSGFYGIMADTSTTVNSVQINDVASSFCLLSVTVDYGLDSVSIYLDGNLIKSQSVRETFGKPGPPNLPSMVGASSFEYGNTYEGQFPFNPPKFPPNSLGQTDFWYFDGPKFASINNGPPMTPWIIGGGFTDGMSSLSPNLTSNEGMNFMGGKWGGRKSGLNGFIGSFKLYNKPLVASSIRKNFDAQKGFFKNLKV